MYFAYSRIISKDGITILVLCLNYYFFNRLSSFHTVSTEYINFFASFNHFFLFIYFFVTLKNLLLKMFLLKLQYVEYTTHLFTPPFYTSKYPSSTESLNMLHCWFSASVYLHYSTMDFMIQHTPRDGSFYFVLVLLSGN